MRRGVQFDLEHDYVGLVKAREQVTEPVQPDCRTWHNPGPLRHWKKHVSLYQSDRNQVVPSACVNRMQGSLSRGCYRQHQAEKWPGPRELSYFHSMWARMTHPTEGRL